jgi:hypothetical protein
MSNNNFDTLARNFLKANKNSIPGIDKYMSLLDSEDGKKLLGQLSTSGGDTLKKNAEKAAMGDKDATKQLIKSLLGGKEGRELAAKVMEIKKSMDN